MKIARTKALLVGLMSLITFSPIGRGELHSKVQSPREFTEPSQVKASCDKMVIVTHASIEWDYTKSTQRSLTALLNRAEKKAKVIHLQSKIDDKSYFCQHLPSDFIVRSAEGELCFPVKSQRLILAGGNFSDCQRQTVNDLIAQIAADKTPATDVYLIGPAVYDYVNSPPYPEGIREKARRAREARKLVSGEDAPSFNFSEIMGWFDSDKDRLAFLGDLVKNQYLKKGDLKNAHVEAALIFNTGVTGRISSIVAAPKGAAQTVRFHFIVPQYADKFEPLIDEVLQ